MKGMIHVVDFTITLANDGLRKLGLEDTALDPSTGLLITPEQSVFMCRISCMCIPVGIYAIYRGHGDLSLVPLGVFVTSIQYWSHPTRSWRRNLDMTYVISSIFYQMYRSIGSQYAVYYYVMLFMAIACYPLSLHVYPRHLWLSVVIHGMLHVFAHISNVILYSGYVKPFACVYDSSHACCS